MRKETILHAWFQTLEFSVIALIIIPSESKLANCLSYVPFLANFARKKVDQAFFVTVKTIIDFVLFLSHTASKKIPSHSHSNMSGTFYLYT